MAILVMASRVMQHGVDRGDDMTAIGGIDPIGQRRSAVAEIGRGGLGRMSRQRLGRGSSGEQQTRGEGGGDFAIERHDLTPEES